VLLVGSINQSGKITVRHPSRYVFVVLTKKEKNLIRKKKKKKKKKKEKKKMNKPTRTYIYIYISLSIRSFYNTHTFFMRLISTQILIIIIIKCDVVTIIYDVIII
jgi:hypothetical protein